MRRAIRPHSAGNGWPSRGICRNIPAVSGIRSLHRGRVTRLDMWILLVATLCAGLFAGAAIYINAVEHPARLSCGTELAVREFAPSYHRATLLQVPLALVGCGTGLWS